MSQSARRRLLAQMAAAARELAEKWSDRDCGEATPDTVAQAAVCAAPILAAVPDSDAAVPWLLEQIAPWERVAIEEAARLPLSGSLPTNHLYDAFLQLHANDHRKRHGVFFTPQPIADYIIRRINVALSECGVDSLHSALRIPHSAFLLDPACGTGVFLLAALDFLHTQAAADWNSVVPGLLPRLVGIEILPAAAFLAKLNIALKLAETGYDFRQPGRIEIRCGDALNPKSQIPNPKSPFPIVLGNPPFSSLSTNTNDWIARLVRGDEQTRGYVRAGDQRLGERKTWLHDDYVKFIRLAQWHIEQADRGIVAFVTNRGYLDNATFRLMRQELLRVFPQMEILDLHGSRKADEVAPSGEPDESVFGLDQGVAIGVFSKPRESVSQRFDYAELWGTREAKLDSLATKRSQPSADASRSPVAPDFCFTRRAQATCHPDYDRGWSLADAMPLNATAPVTARDRFVVAFTEDELQQRIAEFRDLSIPDDEIRRRYFQRTRSARYETGDSRSWKLAAARAAVAADCAWQDKIVRCLYRPFDWRFVFWHPAMIDWPRTEVTQHLLGSGFGVQGSAEGSERFADPEPRTLNPEPSPLCLIARRQQPPGQPCSYFWIADGLALDGVIRSDNRGSESLFPLYVRADDGWRANFAAEFVSQFADATELRWLPLGRGDLEHEFGPEDVLGYVYALFYAPRYRQRYAAALCTSFPRVILPKSGEQFCKLCRAGRELIELHLLRGEITPASVELAEVQTFRAGGYVALRKWLQPPGRSAADPQYARIAAAIARTLALMRQIDRDFTP